MINLFGLVNKINLMPNTKEKALEICLLYSYVNFYLDSKQITREEAINILSQVNERETFYRRYIRNEERSVIDLYNSCDKLNAMYKSILTHANNYELFLTRIPDHINFDKLLNQAKEFMRFIDSDVLDLFNKLYDNYHVFEKTSDDCGICYRLNGEMPGIIMKYNNITLDKIVGLVHEMGHAYFYYLGRNNPSIIKSNLTTECMSRIFENLFIEYLKANYKINIDTVNRYERCFNMTNLAITNSVYIVNELIMNDKLDVNFQIDKAKATLPFEEYYDLSIIKPKNNDHQKFLSFNYNYYAYAYMLSMVIKEMFKHNELEARDFIKKLPVYARELEPRDFINLFDKTDYINATNKNISQVFSKTFYKKIKAPKC